MSSEGLNYVARIVFEAIESCMAEDSCYLSEKKEDFKRFDKFRSLLDLNNYDGEIISLVSNRVGCSEQDLKTTIKTIRYF